MDFGSVSLARGPFVDAAAERRSRLILYATAALALLVIAQAAFIVTKLLTRPPPPPTTGRLAVTSAPQALQVIIDGAPRGQTPLTLELEKGAHSLEVVDQAGQSRSLVVNIPAGAESAHHIEFAPATQTTGGLLVETTPPGARVFVDGEARGITPVTLASLAPGERQVTLEARGESVRRQVAVVAGETARLGVQMPAPAAPLPAPGWISVESPFDLQVYDQGVLLGGPGRRLTLPPGRRTLELVNDALDYRSTQTVDIRAGRGDTLTVARPQGSVNINATPWADVWIGGERLGETPIANLTMAIGVYQVRFVHPELGEAHRTLVVRATGSSRLSVDLRR